MRLDHFVVAAPLLPRVTGCEVVAPRAGVDTRGPRGHPASFFGSDHWPLWLTLGPPPAPEAEAGSPA